MRTSEWGSLGWSVCGGRDWAGTEKGTSARRASGVRIFHGVEKTGVFFHTMDKYFAGFPHNGKNVCLRATRGHRLCGVCRASIRARTARSTMWKTKNHEFFVLPVSSAVCCACKIILSVWMGLGGAKNGLKSSENNKNGQKWPWVAAGRSATVPALQNKRRRGNYESKDSPQRNRGAQREPGNPEKGGAGENAGNRPCSPAQCSSSGIWPIPR